MDKKLFDELLKDLRSVIASGDVSPKDIAKGLLRVSEYKNMSTEQLKNALNEMKDIVKNFNGPDRAKALDDLRDKLNNSFE